MALVSVTAGAGPSELSARRQLPGENGAFLLGGRLAGAEGQQILKVALEKSSEGNCDFKI